MANRKGRREIISWKELSKFLKILLALATLVFAIWQASHSTHCTYRHYRKITIEEEYR